MILLSQSRWTRFRRFSHSRWVRLRLFLGRYGIHCIVAASILVTSVAFVLRQAGLIGSDTATLIITAVTAIGTLLVVSVSLSIARSSIEYGERVRHDAVRPALTLRYSWRHAPLSEFSLDLQNWGAGAAIDLSVEVRMWEVDDDHELHEYHYVELPRFGGQ